jgi:hypothetical protein
LILSEEMISVFVYVLAVTSVSFSHAFARRSTPPFRLFLRGDSQEEPSGDCESLSTIAPRF